MKSWIMPLCLGLAGCGSAAPSQDDAQAAIVRHMMGPDSKAINSKSLFLKGDGGRRQYVEVEKLGCQTSETDPSQICLLNVSTCVAKDASGCEPTMHANKRGRFTKADNGDWHYSPVDMVDTLPRPVELADMMALSDITAAGGMVGCFDNSLSGKTRQIAEAMGGTPCQ